MTMNALQPYRDPSPSPVPSRKTRVRSRSQKHPSSQRSPHQALVIESTAKLTINLVLMAAAVSTLVRLIPYNTQQQADLQHLQAEVTEIGKQVATLQGDFDRHFDPQQALNVMQEQSIRFNPKQRQVVWLEPSTKTANKSSEGAQQADATAPD